MKRYYAVGSLVVSMMLLLLSRPGDAYAQGCASLGGTIVGAECQISTTVHKSGTFNLEAGLTLHLLTSAGKIITDGNNIEIKVHGRLIMDAGTEIDADKAQVPNSCPMGGAITLLVDFDVILKAGGGGIDESYLHSNSCSGGPIVIQARSLGKIQADGTIESHGDNKNTAGPGGGTIFLETPCELTVTGIVSSRGFDPGADLVRLVGGCFVKVFGLVESSGVGHIVPSNPANHCNGKTPVPPFPGNPGPFPAGFRPDKPANSTACIEIWAGNPTSPPGGDAVVIDSIPPNKGQLNANTGGPNGFQGTSWIDIFAVGSILIKGPTATLTLEDPCGKTAGCNGPIVKETFSVHANGNSATNDDGGIITVKSADASVRASGYALQADAIKPGIFCASGNTTCNGYSGNGQGGDIVVQGKTNVNLNDAAIFARGDLNPFQLIGSGGTIEAKAFVGSLNWTDTPALLNPSVGDVTPNGQGLPRGTIVLAACAAGPDVTGTSFPVIPGPPFVAAFPTLLTSCGDPGPLFASYVVFPTCTCGTTPGCPCVTDFSKIPAGGGQPVKVQLNGTQLTAVTEVRLSAGSCEPASGTVAPILTQNASSIQVNASGFTGTFNVITKSAGGSCCSAATVTLP
jgi:hypothetical protein